MVEFNYGSLSFADCDLAWKSSALFKTLVDIDKTDAVHDDGKVDLEESVAQSVTAFQAQFGNASTCPTDLTIFRYESEQIFRAINKNSDHVYFVENLAPLAAPDYEINSARIDGKILKVTVSYDGDGSEHPFDLAVLKNPVHERGGNTYYRLQLVRNDSPSHGSIKTNFEFDLTKIVADDRMLFLIMGGSSSLDVFAEYAPKAVPMSAPVPVAVTVGPPPPPASPSLLDENSACYDAWKGSVLFTQLAEYDKTDSKPNNGINDDLSSQEDDLLQQFKGKYGSLTDCSPSTIATLQEDSINIANAMSKKRSVKLVSALPTKPELKILFAAIPDNQKKLKIKISYKGSHAHQFGLAILNAPEKKGLLNRDHYQVRLLDKDASDKGETTYKQELNFDLSEIASEKAIVITLDDGEQLVYLPTVEEKRKKKLHKGLHFRGDLEYKMPPPVVFEKETHNINNEVKEARVVSSSLTAGLGAYYRFKDDGRFILGLELRGGVMFGNNRNNPYTYDLAEYLTGDRAGEPIDTATFGRGNLLDTESVGLDERNGYYDMTSPLLGGSIFAEERLSSARAKSPWSLGIHLAGYWSPSMSEHEGGKRTKLTCDGSVCDDSTVAEDVSDLSIDPVVKSGAVLDASLTVKWGCAGIDLGARALMNPVLPEGFVVLPTVGVHFER